MFSSLRNLFKIPELRNKILFTLFILALYRLGSFIPAPGIDQSAVAAIKSQAEQGGEHRNGDHVARGREGDHPQKRGGEPTDPHPEAAPESGALRGPSQQRRPGGQAQQGDRPPTPRGKPGRHRDARRHRRSDGQRSAGRPAVPRCASIGGPGRRCLSRRCLGELGRWGVRHRFSTPDCPDERVPRHAEPPHQLLESPRPYPELGS